MDAVPYRLRGDSKSDGIFVMFMQVHLLFGLQKGCFLYNKFDLYAM